MKIIAVVGTGSGCGKTTVACRILRGIPGLGAVKISPRVGESRVEWGPGEPGKDTDLFARSGGAPVARIVGPREQVQATWDRIRSRFAGCPAVVVEGASALGIPGDRFIVLVVGDTREDPRDDRNRPLAALADIIVDRSARCEPDLPGGAMRAFLSSTLNE